MPFSVLCELSHLESTVTEQPCAGDHPTLHLGKLRPTGTHLPEPGAWGWGWGGSQGHSCAPWGGGISLRLTGWCPGNPSTSDLLGLPHTWLLGLTGSPVCGAPGWGQMGWEGLGAALLGQRLAAAGNGECLMSSQTKGSLPCTSEAPRVPHMFLRTLA